jgi:hypothetical protein
MKSKMRLKLIFQICFFFFFITINAQKNVSRSVLLGEWYYKLINDTVTLEKKNTDNTIYYKKWIFKESNEFIFEAVTHGKYDYVGSYKGDTWYFNDTTKQVKIVQRKTSFYRIISFDKYFVKLIEIK